MSTTTSPMLYSLSLKSQREWIIASLFVIGNLLLPQLVHLIPHGGYIWLPIYFFTLVGAYKYGWRVGLLTAIASPLLNCMLFGMPAITTLPAIMMKSVLLAVFAGLANRRFGSASILVFAAIVLAYQLVGTVGEWIMSGDIYAAMQDFRIGLPGMLVQIIGGWAIVNYLLRK